MTIALLLALLGSTSIPDAQAKQAPARRGSIVAEHLARLDAANRPVPPGWVRQIDDAFAALERKCWQRRGAVGQEQAIADMAFRAVRELRQAKNATTHLEFLMTMTQFIPQGSEDQIDCAEVSTSAKKSLRALQRDRR